MKAELLRFALDRRGATATEYGLVVAGIGLAIASIIGQVVRTSRTRLTQWRRI